MSAAARADQTPVPCTFQPSPTKRMADHRDSIMIAGTPWEIPEPLSECEVRLDDHTVTTVRQHGNPAGPRLVLSHGNGLAIDLYLPFWSLLADDFELMIHDLRNHGRNFVGNRRAHTVPVLIRDHGLVLETIDRRYGTKPTTGVFHSVSALIALLSPARSLSAQVLFDPPVCKPGPDRQVLDTAAERAAAICRRRAYRFPTEREFVELLQCLPAFTRVVPGVRELMARTTLRRSGLTRDYELRCPREYEAQIMDHIRSASPLVDFGALPCPTRAIGADPSLPYAYLPSFDLGGMATSDLDYDFIPDTTHLLQLEKPRECAAAVREFMELHGPAQTS